MLLSVKSRKRVADYTNKIMDQVMQNLHHRRIRCVISGWVRGCMTNAAANDNGAATASASANDNHAPELPAKHRRPVFLESYLSVVQEQQGSPRIILSMSQADASALNIKADQYVLVSVIVVTDPYFAKIVEAVSVRRVKRGTQGAVQVEANGEGCRIRVRDAQASLCSQKPVYLSPVRYEPNEDEKAEDLFMPWPGGPLALEDLQTLDHRTQTGLARRLLLAKWTAFRAKGAGDECYTLRFIYEWGLKAAKRSLYDLDVCSMSNTGHYNAPLSPAAWRKISWSAIPAQYRDDIAAQLAPVPANDRYTDEGPFGALMRPWKGTLFWINPPYSQRLWACFMEQALREVERDGRKIFVTLGPDDNCGSHAAPLYERHAYRITLERQLPFCKVRSSSIETIRNNQIVVFGRGVKMYRFLRRLATIMQADGVISAEQKAKIIRESWLYLR
ncbi:hypothetical protein JK208_14220 [Gluconobacter sp. Dm-74]|uniref:hypothetical protein n=1 Tax=Gluconobacter sp. Dm-74 TaxID=2799803 RepID=UPI001B8CBECF|nr:hypothetical protein [Gluconobacter sp. Dm-74]MBS1092738.1 hypothetical protein [Gluconobacter sp. Dm-74]